MWPILAVHLFGMRVRLRLCVPSPVSNCAVDTHRSDASQHAAGGLLSEADRPPNAFHINAQFFRCDVRQLAREALAASTLAPRVVVWLCSCRRKSRDASAARDLRYLLINAISRSGDEHAKRVRLVLASHLHLRLLLRLHAQTDVRRRRTYAYFTA